MTEVENSRLCKFSMLLTSLMLSFSGGCQFVVLNPLSPVLRDVFNETYESRYNEPIPESTWISLLSITLSSIIIGGFVGAMSVKPALGYMSRKRLMQTAHVNNLVSIILVAVVGKLTGSYEVFIIGRIVAGFSLGALFSLIPIMIAETSTKLKQGLWQGMMGIGLSFGLLCGSILGHSKVFGSHNLWPLAIAFSGIPSIIYLVASYWIPNTVLYVMRLGDKDNTMKLLKQMRVGNKNDLETEYEAMEDEMKGCGVVGIVEVMKTKQYRWQLIIVLCILAHHQISGVNNFSLYSDRIFIGAGISPEYATYGTIGMFALQFLMAIIGTKLLDRFGGRKVLLSAASGQIFALVLFTVSQATVHLAPHIIPYLAIVSAAIFFSCWSGGTNLASMDLLGSVTIEPTRPSILAYGGLALWPLGWFVGFIPPYLEIGLGAYSMVLWLVSAIILLIFFIIFIPETKGRSVQQIQQKFKAKRTESSAPLSSEEKV